MMKGYQVKHFMRKEVKTIDHTETVMEATKIMTTENYEGYVIVLKKGKPQGIVLERDIISKVLANDRDPSTTQVSAIMASPLITIDPDEDLAKASQLMVEHNVRKLVVLRNDIIYGILTSKDVSQHFQDYVDRSVRDIIRWTASLGI